MPPMISADFSEATSGGIAPGSYKARITGSELKTTQAGLPRVVWTLTIFGAEDEAAKFNNWSVRYSTMAAGKGAGMLRDFYQAATGEKAPTHFESEILHGKEIQIVLVEGKDKDGNPSQFADVKRVGRLQQ